MAVSTYTDNIKDVSASSVSVYCGSQDPYVNYGLQHFLKKYGLSFAERPEDAAVHLSYKPEESESPGIQILIHQAAQDGLSFLNLNHERVPVFVVPAGTSGDECLIKTKNGSESYACASINRNTIMLGFDIFAENGRIISGYYDNYFLKKDKTGQILRSLPVVDILEECLFSAISKLMPGQHFSRRFTWPDGHKFAVVLTHDVDQVYKTHQYIVSIINSLKRVDLSDLSQHVINMLFKHGTKNPYWTFKTMCSLENSLGVKSTYYFLNESGKINPFNLKSWILYNGRYNIEKPVIQKSIRELDNMGFEIGVHGSYNSFNRLELLQKEKCTLKSITGKELNGIRQHYLNYDANITPYIHCDCGFKYDTSIGFKPATGIGFRRGTSFPFPVMLPDLSVSPLLEIPLIIMDSAIGNTAASEECFPLIEQVEKYGGVLTILWHTTAFNKHDKPVLFNLYERIIREAQRRNAWITRADEVYKRIMGDN